MSYGRGVSVCLLSAAQISAALIKREDNNTPCQGHTHLSASLLLYKLLSDSLVYCVLHLCCICTHLSSSDPSVCFYCLPLFILNFPFGFSTL